MGLIVQPAELTEIVDCLMFDGKFEELCSEAALYHEWGDDPGFVEGVRGLAEVIDDLKPGQKVFEVVWDKSVFIWFVGASEDEIIKRLEAL
jgi:hypothetical protein